MKHHLLDLKNYLISKMNEDLKQQVIDYSLKLNSTNLSPLRSGNLSVRAKIDDDEGFLYNSIRY